MTDTDPVIAARSRLDRALAEVAEVFRGEVAAPDESNCECHWGSAAELALLKTPDLPLGADLLRRSWWLYAGWTDHAAVLRRVLPELTAALAGGLVPEHDLAEVGASFARGCWRDWPAPQSEAVGEFLRAWWLHTLVSPEAAGPAHAAFGLCAEAANEAGPWIASWESVLGNAQADRALTRAAEKWADDLRFGQQLWGLWLEDEEVERMTTELTDWLIRVGRLAADAAAW